jgi:hypothetical protein
MSVFWNPDKSPETSPVITTKPHQNPSELGFKHQKSKKYVRFESSTTAV